MLRVKARAKINWTLDITGVRADGYHLMDMLMSSVELCDTLWLEKADALTLAVEKPQAEGCSKQQNARNLSEKPQRPEADQATALPVPLDERNLVIKAAKALQGETGYAGGASMRLVKRIPVGAGMGGGSADAAAALVGLNELWGLGLPKDRLLSIGLAIGADVPFLVTGGFARVQGIGDILLPLPVPRPSPLVVVQPCEGLSTPEIFHAFDATYDGGIVRPQADMAAKALQTSNMVLLASSASNVMEPVSVAKRPQIGEAICMLEQYGAAKAMMTGSGSAVFGVFADKTQATEACERLSRQYEHIWLTQTAQEGITWEYTL